MIEKISEGVFRETGEIVTEYNLADMEAELARLQALLDADNAQAARSQAIKAQLDLTSLSEDEKNTMMMPFLTGSTGVSDTAIAELQAKIDALKAI